MPPYARAGGVERLAVFVMIVAAIGLDQARFGQRTTAPAANGWDRLHERQQLGDIVAIGAGQDHRKRDALRFRDEMVLGTWASAIGGVGSCF